MAKAKSIYSCTECGATSPKWQGSAPVAANGTPGRGGGGKIAGGGPLPVPGADGPPAGSGRDRSAGGRTHRHRHRRIRPHPGGAWWPAACGPDRRRPGDRQSTLLPRPCRRCRRTKVLYERRGIGEQGCPAGPPPQPGDGRPETAGEINLKRSSPSSRTKGPRSRSSIDSDPVVGGPVQRPGVGGPGAGMWAQLTRLAKQLGNQRHPGRPRDQGGRLAGPGCSSISSIRCSISKATPIRAFVHPGVQESLLARSTNWASSP